MFTGHKIRKKYLLAGILFLVLLFGTAAQADASWVKNSDGTYSYYKANGKLVKNKWVGKKYYVGAKGVRLTGIQKLKSKWYYFTEGSGKLATNRWVVEDGKKYYAGKDGKLYVNGIYKIGENSYLFNSKGAMLTGKQTFKKKTYFFGADGAMLKMAWVKIGKYFYYFGKDGATVKNTWVSSKEYKYVYYVGSKSYRLSNRWQGSRYLGADGKSYSGLCKVGSNYYYFDPQTRKKVTDTRITVDGCVWEFNAKGVGTKEHVPAPGAGVSVQPQYYTDPVVDDETLLSYIIYCEAGNQQYEGKLGVGYVIMNRVYSALFRSSTIREVVYERNQFNPTWDGAMARVYRNPSLVTEECKKAAREVLSQKAKYEAGKTPELKINGKKTEFSCLFFMTESSYRGLGLSAPYVKIGAHVFFKVWR